MIHKTCVCGDVWQWRRTATGAAMGGDPAVATGGGVRRWRREAAYGGGDGRRRRDGRRRGRASAASAASATTTTTRLRRLLLLLLLLLRRVPGAAVAASGGLRVRGALRIELLHPTQSTMGSGHGRRLLLLLLHQLTAYTFIVKVLSNTCYMLHSRLSHDPLSLPRIFLETV